MTDVFYRNTVTTNLSGSTTYHYGVMTYFLAALSNLTHSSVKMEINDSVTPINALEWWEVTGSSYLSEW